EKLAAFARSRSPKRPRGRGKRTGRYQGIDWKLWENGSTLRVRFLDGSAELRERVMKAAREWTRYANLHFTVVESGGSDIRISFSESHLTPYWSYIGADAKNADDDERTLSLAGFTDKTPDSLLKPLVLEYFGYVLGLIKEHQNPNAHIRWNEK